MRLRARDPPPSSVAITAKAGSRAARPRRNLVILQGKCALQVRTRPGYSLARRAADPPAMSRMTIIMLSRRAARPRRISAILSVTLALQERQCPGYSAARSTQSAHNAVHPDLGEQRLRCLSPLSSRSAHNADTEDSKSENGSKALVSEIVGCQRHGATEHDRTTSKSLEIQIPIINALVSILLRPQTNRTKTMLNTQLSA